MNSVVELIQGNEGLRLRPYTDTVGLLTIGYGRNLDDVGISSVEAQQLFQNDLDSANRNLEAGVPWSANLDEVRKAVMLDLTFNLGLSKLLTFTTFLKLMAMGQYGEAADDLLQTAYARQVGHRAIQNAQLLRTGQWPL